MSDFIYNIKDTTAMYLSLHSYSQLILTPWGWTKDLPDDYPDLEKRGLHAKAAIKANSGKIYNVGSSTRVLCMFFDEFLKMNPKICNLIPEIQILLRGVVMIGPIRWVLNMPTPLSSETQAIRDSCFQKKKS